MTWQDYSLWMAGEIKWPVTVIVCLWLIVRSVSIHIDR